MTKKLFVVLVLVAAMLLTISLAMAAKKILKGTPETYEVRKFMDQQSATPMPVLPTVTEKHNATILATGHSQKTGASSVPAGPLAGEINRRSGKDFCDLYGSAAYLITDWFYGLEWYANYQDPEEFGCAAVWPFLVLDVGFNINVDAAISIDVQGFVYSATGPPECPVPFEEICATPVYTIDIPGGGHWSLGLPLQEECCVYEPYFAVIYILTDLYGTGADAVSEDMLPCDCRSYNDYGAGWEDLCVNYGWPGPMMLWSDGYTSPQNDCPTEGDTCGVSSITPPVIEVLPGGTADFTANVYFTGTQTECNLVVTPDPVCPTCVTTITPNPVSDPPVATVTIVTDPSTPPGTYVFDVNGSKASATLEVLAVDDTCELARDNDSWVSYFSGYRVGDQNAMLMDPEEMCIGCGPDVYPFALTEVKAMFYDFAGTLPQDVEFHVYEAPEPYCDGPGLKVYSFPGTATLDFEWDTFPLPEPFCVDGPFWLAVEYTSGTEGSIACLLMDNQDYNDTCTQFNWRFYDPDWMWREWADFWTPPPPGYLSLRGIGLCDGPCPVACDLIQDAGWIAYYFGAFAAGDAIAKYFDPEVYCEPEVYPYKIHDVEFLLYDFAGVGTIDIIVDVHVVCQDTCDGPGTRIYQSPPITVTDFYGDMAHIVLPEQVCVWEPFFISLEYATGEQESTPSFLWPDETEPCDSCHVWMYWASGGYPFWTEWNDFWSPPAGGCPIIRVTGFTEHPDCDFEPCDTTLDTLMGATYAYYYWRNPSVYGDRYLNERFDMPLAGAGGRLDEIQIAFYDAGTGAMGTPDPEIYVWLSDGLYPIDNNPPYQAIAQFNMAYGDIVWFTGMNVIQTHELGMMFDAGESFHIGYGHAFIDGDTLCTLSDDGYYVSDRSVEWAEPGQWGTMLADWDIGIDFMINAVICPNELSESTFTVSASPFLNFATPGDLPAVLYEVTVGSLIGYNLPVTLSCTPPDPNISVSFSPNPVTPPGASDVTVTVNPGVTYGDYTLSFCGTGSDGQGPKCCNVTLRVQAPYDECLVDFFHGKQRITNFGAVGDHNNASQSFLWYGITDLLFDGSFIIATDVDHMALDFGRTHVYHDFVPVDYMDCYYDDKWPANIGYADFYSEANIPGEHDSVYVIGIMDSCVDFSIKVKIYYNDGPDPIENMYIAMFEDWDFGDAYNNWGALDFAHNLVWMYEPLDTTFICGLFKAPFYDDPDSMRSGVRNVQIVHNAYITWPNEGYGLDPDSLWRLLTFEGEQEATYVGPDSQDYSVMITAEPITLAARGGKHIEIWIDFCRDTDIDNLTWEQWYHRVLRYAGFYRGDVNASDTLELPQLDVSDLVYLIQYLFQNGPAPLPYADQGDVNANVLSNETLGTVNVGDVVYLLNYIFLDGPAPVDYVRFIPSLWSRGSLFENDTWK